jgi:hypothetical protein
MPAELEFERPPQRRPQVTPVIFVGGTGRSGTHIVARLLGRHGKITLIPVECRFHVEDRGFPGLLAGTTTKEQFLRRLRGFWWKGFQTNRMRGLYRFVPRDRFDAAADRFDAGFDSEPELACRNLFFDLLFPEATDVGASGIIEQSCETISQAPTLVRLFPEASFIHAVRDGRDASASRVAQTKGLIPPRTRAAGLEWWERRLREMDAGSRAIPEDRLLEVSLDELLSEGGREDLERIMGMAGISAGRQVRKFFRNKMSSAESNAERWRSGLRERSRERVDRLYAEALDRLEADGIRTAPLLRRTWDRRGGVE